MNKDFEIIKKYRTNVVQTLLQAVLESENLQVFNTSFLSSDHNYRKANLYFNQDDFGMLRHKGLTRYKDFLFRAARTESAVPLNLDLLFLTLFWYS